MGTNPYGDHDRRLIHYIPSGRIQMPDHLAIFENLLVFTGAGGSAAV